MKHPRHLLRAGNLSLVYQNGFLRYLKLGEQEVIRMIYHAVRDQNWGTVPMDITEENIQQREDSFEISYQARCQQDDIDFQLQCELRGSSEGEITFSYHGLAHSSFLRNRVGFLLLHPITPSAGNPVTIIHPDGSKTDTHFPEQISPHQPFFDIREMRWPIGEWGEAQVRFEGDIFETEDQRNWTDASYKTYCTPLSLPFPAQVKAGDEVRQHITVRVSSHKPLPKFAAQPTIQFHLQDTAAFPQLGTECREPGEAKEKAFLQAAPFDYVRIELPLEGEQGKALALLRMAEELDLAVELCVFTDQADWVDRLTRLPINFELLHGLLLFPEQPKTTPQAVTDQVATFRTRFPDLPILAGTDAFFTELNRSPIDAQLLDGVSYSLNPQVHAFDDASLVETLEIQAATVRSAQQLFPGKQIRVGPISFHMRWNPNGTDPSTPVRARTGWTDPRQFSFFGACWWLISLKYLAEAGAESITYFEAWGKNGWAKPLSKGNEILFPSPIFSLLEEITPWKAGKIRKLSSSHPLLADAIFFETADKTSCFVVNWSEEKQVIALPAGLVPRRHCHETGPNGQLQWAPLAAAKAETWALFPLSITQLEPSR
jgi:hypothetical protein